MRPGRRAHGAEQRPRRGRRQGRRPLRAAVPARHRHGHVHGEAGYPRRRHRRRQHRNRLRARSVAPGRRRSDDDHGGAEPGGDARRSGGPARHARGGRRADARSRDDRRAGQRPRRSPPAPSRPLQRRDQRLADCHRSRISGHPLRGRQRDHRRRPARVARSGCPTSSRTSGARSRSIGSVVSATRTSSPPATSCSWDRASR